MAYYRVQLYDPSPGGLGAYNWQINYSDEGEFGQERNIDATENLAGTGFIVQQGGENPMTISVSGTILHQNQHVKFVQFYKRSQNQTLIFTDFTGEQYEVMIRAYKPTRKRTLRNPRDKTIPSHYYTYSMEMMVLSVRAGVWA